MTAAELSLAALLVAIGLSVVSRLNVGIVAIAFAWLIGTFAAGWKVDTLLAGFPAPLFLTLVGVTLLFGVAETNGTLDRLTTSALRVLGRRSRWLPWSFFLVAGLVSSIGPGAIIAVALIVPIAMAVGTPAGVPPFLTALMVANGANAGGLSALSSVGIIANTKMAEAGLIGHETKVWFANFAAHLLVATVAYFGLGGHRLADRVTTPVVDRPKPLDRGQVATIAVVVLWIVGVIGWRLHIGLAAFGAVGLLLLLRASDETAALRRVPWGVVLMVTGVSVLISVLEKTGGMDLFSGLLSRLATPGSVNGVIAFVTGAISTYSSTSGVVLPAFLPTAADLVTRLGGGDPLAVALSINVGASLVDVSPLSTLGALCVATVADPTAGRQLFRQLMAWGLGMTLVGALLCQLFAGPIARL
ncbi:MAG: SLC13 family permease [Gemmatimonadales bacterium]